MCGLNLKAKISEKGRALKVSDQKKVRFENVKCHELDMKKGKKMDINKFHVVLGHVHKAMLRKTAKSYNVGLTGKLVECSSCALAKSKKKKMTKVDTDIATVKGERICIDISYIANPSYGGAQFWVLVVDQYSIFKWSKFIKEKSNIDVAVSEVIREINADGYAVNKIRCDNAGEHANLKENLHRKGLNKIQVEYTAPYTPQQNGIVEISFAFLYNRIRAMLNGAMLSKGMRNSLWPECARTAVMLDNGGLAIALDF